MTQLFIVGWLVISVCALYAAHKRTRSHIPFDAISKGVTYLITSWVIWLFIFWFITTLAG